ncbi:MAG: lipopolysaccharide/colanic/teichoic acid biosynthesis glycosyltransferase [Ulvibacter sp.]|jgi:lipopolysaccharide/colanic/teichoic acid biosynthesis glycosyltransferase
MDIPAQNNNQTKGIGDGKNAKPSIPELTNPLWNLKPLGSKPAAWWEQSEPEARFENQRTYEITKRFIDLLIVVLSLPLLFPLLVVCAIIIKIESPKGSVFFFQQRTGKDGKRFKMYKFRTMVHNADELKIKLSHLNELQWPDFKIANDPRITKFGRFLRKTSLDELPQILNVLTGEMSFVGPRPTSFKPETYSLWHTERLEVKPGVTGLWQIMGRGSMEFDERVRLDVSYIIHRSLKLDIWIIFQTFKAVLYREGK